MIGIIITAFIAISLLYLIIKDISAVLFIKRSFSQGNVITFGSRGTGKDVIMQLAINLRKKEYYSNVNYGGKYNYGSAKMLDLSPNDYTRLINDDVVVLDKTNYPFEHKDFYFSDAGIIFPSQYDTLLHKQYKTFPVAYALSRHLWENNIHCNTQALDRVWKALREQADTYIRCTKTIKLPFILIVKFTTYDKYTSAQQCLNPMPKHLFGKYDKRTYEQYVATNGNIENHFIIVRKRKIKYDTRAYHKIIFGFSVSRKGAKVLPLSDGQK